MVGRAMLPSPDAIPRSAFARRATLLVFVLAAWVLAARGADWHVAPSGEDTASGGVSAPFATLMRAQAAASAGDTVWIEGGTYLLTDQQIARSDTLYAYVHDFTKAGIAYRALPGRTPVFDFSAVRPSARRITAFYIRTHDLRFEGFHVVGVQVVIRAGEATNTQSECFRIQNGNRNILDRLVLRDGMGIGVYIIGNSADNLVVDCDAYNNAGLDSLSIGNVDGFGAHTSANGPGNTFRRCRAWLNSDDGFDFINCRAPAVIEECVAAFNGYLDATLSRGGDGTGFKAGGYGRNGSALPSPVPRHVVRRSLAVYNRANGFYANHHPGGLDFLHNTAFRNANNFSFLNVLPDNLTDVPGYAHLIKNNLSFSARSNAVVSLEPAACDSSHNSFDLPVTVTSADFVSAPNDVGSLLAAISVPRGSDGRLPDLDLLSLRDDSDLIDRGTPLPGDNYHLSAPDLGWRENVYTPPGAYGRWSLLQFPIGTPASDAAPVSDPDNDGLANLLEFFHASDPHAASPAGERTAMLRQEDGALALRFPVTRELGEVTWQVEYSTDLTLWQTTSHPFAVETQDLDRVYLRVPLPTPTPALFWRLKIMLPEG